MRAEHDSARRLPGGAALVRTDGHCRRAYSSGISEPRQTAGELLRPLVDLFLPSGPGERFQHGDIPRLSDIQLARELGRAKFLWLWVGDTEPWIGQRLERLQHERKRRKGQAP